MANHLQVTQIMCFVTEWDLWAQLKWNDDDGGGALAGLPYHNLIAWTSLTRWSSSWLVVSKFSSELWFEPELAWTEPKVQFKVQQNGWTEPKVQFTVQAMREEFKPEPNLELQYTKNTLKFNKSLYFQYNFGTDYLLDVICYWLEGKPLPERVFRLYQQIFT